MSNTIMQSLTFITFIVSEKSQHFSFAMPYNHPAGWLIVRCGKNFNVAVFSDTMNVINFKLCMMVLLIELYLFIPLSVILTIFHGRSSVKKF